MGCQIAYCDIYIYIPTFQGEFTVPCPLLKHPAALLFGTSVHLYQMTRRHIPKEIIVKILFNKLK